MTVQDLIDKLKTFESTASILVTDGSSEIEPFEVALGEEGDVFIYIDMS